MASETIVSKPALLIVNRNSRCGTENIDEVMTRLDIAGISVILEQIDDAGCIDLLIHARKDEVGMVIVGGGDGSMNAAASALAATQLPLGVLPLGTANDLARTLGIPVDLSQAADIIAQGMLHRIDLGRVNDRYFFNVANIGLGVQVKNRLTNENKRRWGIISYAQSFIGALSSFRPFKASIVCDSRRKNHTSIQIAVGNGRHYGGGMTIADEAHIDDGTLYLYSVKPLSVWELFKCVFAFRSGQFKSRHPIFLDHGKDIEISTGRRMAVTADGEQVSSTPAKFTIHRNAISVYIPESYLKQREDEIMLLRDNMQIMLNEIHALCIESADHYTASAGKTQDPGLAHLFIELAAERQKIAGNLAEQIRLLDDQPRMPDPDREAIGDMISDIKLLFVGQEGDTLLQERESLEHRIEEAAEAALKLSLPDPAREVVGEVLRHVHLAIDRLQKAHPSI